MPDNPDDRPEKFILTVRVRCGYCKEVIDTEIPPYTIFATTQEGDGYHYASGEVTVTIDCPLCHKPVDLQLNTW